MQKSFAAIMAVAAVVSAQCVEVVTQIGDGQIQAPHTYTSCAESSVTKVAPYTSEMAMTSEKAVSTSMMVPVEYTTTKAVITSIHDGQIQAPPTPSAEVYTTMSAKEMMSSVPVVYSSAVVTSKTEVMPASVTGTTTMMGSTCVQVITQIGDGQIQAPHTLTTCYPAGAAPSSAPAAPSMPAAPMSSAPAAPMSSAPAAPMSSAPAAPMSSAPAAPMSSAPAAVPSSMMTVGAGSSCVQAVITQIHDGQIQAPTTVVSCAAPAKTSVEAYSGNAAAPTKAAGALGALVLGAAALVLA